VTQPSGGVTRYYYTLHTTDPTDVSCQNGVPVTAPIAGGVTCTSARPVLVVSAEGTRRKLAYDQAGRLVRITDGENNSVTLTYDGLNRLLSVTNPLGHTVSVTYDSRNNPTTITDANGNLSRRFYDANGNLVAYINALIQGTRYDYDGEDRLIRVVDATNRATQLSYDAKNRLVSLTNPLGQTQTLEYDAVDNLIKRVDANGQSVISLSYDNRDNLTHVSDALGNTTAFHYDALSRLIQTTDPLNRVTQFRYDNHNRLVESLDAFLGRSTQQFDADGHRQKLSDAKNNALQFEFDFNSRLVQETDATANQVSYSYNARDLLAQITNGRGQLSNIEYDAAGRITRWTDPDGTVSYTYDANGNVLTVTDSQGTITREYDPLNRVTKYTDTQRNTLQYAYNDVGNLVTLTYPDGRQVHYEYDAANRLAKVVDWAGRVTAYEYDQNGRLIKTLRPNGTQQSRVYDKAGQLLQIKDIVIATGDVISQFDFRYDAAGNITQELVSPPPERFQFTTPVNMTYTAANRLATYNGEAVQFDADGNMTKGPLSGDMANFVFDSRNRLVAAGNTAYHYDAENQRTAISVDGQETHYVINSVPVLSQVLVRTQPDGTQTYYVYGLGLIGQEKQGQYLSYHFDFRGSTVALTNETGQVVERLQYSPYGLLLSGDASRTPFLFNGMYGVMTEASGLYYMRARYYHREIRRFVNQDILKGNIVDGQDLNRYAYVKGKPNSSIDPFGLDDLTGAYYEELAKIHKLSPPPIAPLPEQTPMLMFGLLPIVGELLDVDVLFGISQPTDGWDKLGAGSSLLLSVLTGTLTPNYGAFVRCEELTKFTNKFPEHEIASAMAKIISLPMLKKVSGKFNYVVTEDGKLIVGKKFDTPGGGHIDLANGMPVLAAGELKVVNGELKYIDNTSGHYQPTGESPRRIIEKTLKDLGFDVTDKYVEKVWVQEPKLPKGGAWKPVK
jgi:RHS repeat-associated protein